MVFDYKALQDCIDERLIDVAITNGFSLEVVRDSYVYRLNNLVRINSNSLDGVYSKLMCRAFLGAKIYYDSRKKLSDE